MVAHSVNHRWSPDGSKIAYMNGEDWYNQVLKYYDLKTDSIYTITNRGYMNSGFVWLIDNETIIANLKIRDETMYEFYSVNITTGSIQQITEGINLHPAISADGNRIVFESQRDGNDGEIYVMNTDGSIQTRLTNSNHYSGRPAWFKM